MTPKQAIALWAAGTAWREELWLCRTAGLIGYVPETRWRAWAAARVAVRRALRGVA